MQHHPSRRGRSGRDVTPTRVTRSWVRQRKAVRFVIYGGTRVVPLGPKGPGGKPAWQVFLAEGSRDLSTADTAARCADEASFEATGSGVDAPLTFELVSDDSKVRCRVTATVDGSEVTAVTTAAPTTQLRQVFRAVTGSLIGTLTGTAHHWALDALERRSSTTPR